MSGLTLAYPCVWASRTYNTYRPPSPRTSNRLASQPKGSRLATPEGSPAPGFLSALFLRTGGEARQGSSCRPNPSHVPARLRRAPEHACAFDCVLWCVRVCARGDRRGWGVQGETDQWVLPAPWFVAPPLLPPPPSQLRCPLPPLRPNRDPPLCTSHSPHLLHASQLSCPPLPTQPGTPRTHPDARFDRLTSGVAARVRTHTRVLTRLLTRLCTHKAVYTRLITMLFARVLTTDLRNTAHSEVSSQRRMGPRKDAHKAKALPMGFDRVLTCPDVSSLQLTKVLTRAAVRLQSSRHELTRVLNRVLDRS